MALQPNLSLDLLKAPFQTSPQLGFHKVRLLAPRPTFHLPWRILRILNSYVEWGIENPKPANYESAAFTEIHAASQIIDYRLSRLIKYAYGAHDNHRNFKLLIIFFLFLKDEKLTIRELLKRLEITCWVSLRELSGATSHLGPNHCHVRWSFRGNSRLVDASPMPRVFGPDTSISRDLHAHRRVIRYGYRSWVGRSEIFVHHAIRSPMW